MEAILAYQPWSLGEEKSPAEIIGGRKQGKGLVALLPGCEGRDQAARLVGQQIFVGREQLPPAAEGEYYWSDLEGLEVHTDTKRVLSARRMMIELRRVVTGGSSSSRHCRQPSRK